MDNYIDDNEVYARLRPPCKCGCYPHCGLPCMTDGCDCIKCSCPTCVDGAHIKIGPGNV